MTVNKDQRVILYIASALVVLSVVFPPVRYSYDTHGTTFEWMFDLRGSFVEWGYLVAIQLGIALTATGLCIAVND